MTLGERLKMYRRQTGLSQEKIAEMLGVSRQAVTKWELGQTTPSSDNLIALANLYDVSLDELIGKNEMALAEEEKQKHFSPKQNPILQNNFIIIAIIMQASCLNIAIQPLYTEGTPYHILFLLFKHLPLLAASAWMSFNLHYEKDEKRRKKNTLIELAYCVVMAVIALVVYYTKWYFLAAVALISVALIYIFVINPRYMNRHLVKRKKQ
ncbi:MAG: helix-turn-helix transcriptional regulator [Clostridia bacterium]|nr:helix-turn-helix transcriptional regulator [Clostridia bacterium]